MCCRYYMELSPELRPVVEAMNASPLAQQMVAKLARPAKGFGEVSPSDIAPVIATSKKGAKTVFPMVWGFTGLSSPIFNARSETAAAKPIFREAWQSHRCVIPASWYFEWEHLLLNNGEKRTGTKYALQPEGAALCLFAGLYRMEDGFPHFTVLTREAAGSVRFLHDRMPVILTREAAREWIRPEADASSVISGCISDLRYEKA